MHFVSSLLQALPTAITVSTGITYKGQKEKEARFDLISALFGICTSLCINKLTNKKSYQWSVITIAITSLIDLIDNRFPYVKDKSLPLPSYPPSILQHYHIKPALKMTSLFLAGLAAKTGKSPLFCLIPIMLPLSPLITSCLSFWTRNGKKWI